MLPPPFCHIINPKLKHTYLSFDTNGMLIVKSPGMSEEEVRLLLWQKRAQIDRLRKRHRALKGDLAQCFANGTFYLFGKALKLHIHPCNLSPKLTLQEDGCHYTGEDKSQTFVSTARTFYAEQLREILFPMVERFAQKAKNYPSKVTIRHTKRQWGSCSAQNRLSFSSALAKVPLEAIEYVVAHELAHIRHKHHQKPFWDEVERILPDFRTKKSLLDSYTPR